MFTFRVGVGGGRQSSTKEHSCEAFKKKTNIASQNKEMSCSLVKKIHTQLLAIKKTHLEEICPEIKWSVHAREMLSFRPQARKSRCISFVPQHRVLRLLKDNM